MLSKIKKFNKVISLDEFAYDNNDSIAALDFVSEDVSCVHYEKELYEKIASVLNEKERKIIDMKIEGYSYEEISLFMGITKQSVYRKISRLKNIIKDIIEKID